MLDLLDQPIDLVQSIVKQALRSGQPIPDRILNAPELRFGLMFYLQAFFDLDSERGDGRIPWSAIVRYANHHDLDEEETESLIYFIRAMDTGHLKRIEENTKKK